MTKSVIENAAGLQAALDGAGEAASLLSAKNREMAEAGDTAQFNKDMNDLFKTVSNELFSINWNEEFRFVHQYKQDNVAPSGAQSPVWRRGMWPERWTTICGWSI